MRYGWNPPSRSTKDGESLVEMIKADRDRLLEENSTLKEYSAALAERLAAVRRKYREVEGKSYKEIEKRFRIINIRWNYFTPTSLLGVDVCDNELIQATLKWVAAREELKEELAELRRQAKEGRAPNSSASEEPPAPQKKHVSEQPNWRAT